MSEAPTEGVAGAGAGPAKRLYVYVDGYNLFNGLKDAGYKKYYWLDLWKLGKALEKPGIVLQQVRYFTAYSLGGRPWQDAAKRYDREQSRLRQYSYIEALKTLPNVSVFLGAFRDEERMCSRCGRPYSCLTEKMTDVRLATQIVLDGVDDLFDVAILISADTDQVPAIEICKSRWPKKSVFVAFPPKRSSDDLRRNAHAAFIINASMLRNSLLPERIDRPGKASLLRPAEWA